MTTTILLVDSNAAQLSLKEQVLQTRLHYQTLVVAANEAEVLRALATQKPFPDLALLDLEGADGAALSMLDSIRASHPQLPMIVLVGYGDQERATKAIQAGAHDYLAKPVTVERLRLTIRQAISRHRMGNYIAWLERKIAGHVDFSDMVGTGVHFRQAVDVARHATASTFAIWIEGEAGTGKEFLARAIHGGGERAGKPFVVVNCGLLPQSHAEAVLFGQDRGFSPEGMRFILGKVREAEGGTLLLKDMYHLPVELQRQLLKMVETGAVTPVGALSPVKVNVRLICTATLPTEYVARTGAVDMRLLQALKRTVITLPSLAQRGAKDLHALAEHFVTMYSTSENKYIQGLTDRALQWLSSAAWPGNITQLANVVWRAVMLSEAARLDVDDFQLVQKAKPIYLSEPPRISGITNALMDANGKVKTLKLVEEEAIRFALGYADGCMMRAAKSLGIGRSTLYRKVHELQIDGYISRANQTTRPMISVSATDLS